MQTLKRVVLGAASISLLLFLSCSGKHEELPVAKIKDRMITLGDFENAYLNVNPRFLPETRDLAGLKEFLDTMVKREIMSLKADELGYDKDPYVIEGMKAFRQVGLQAGYLKIKVADKIKVTEKDLRDAYERYGVVMEVKQILADTETEAYEVRELLERGHDFESVCKEHSKGPDAHEGGKVIILYPQDLPPHYQEELFSTKIGGITQPVINPYGYFIFKVIASKRPAPKPFEDLRAELEERVMQQKQLKASFELSARIRKKHGFEWYDDNLKIVFAALPADRPLTDPPDRDLEVYPLLDFALEDLDKPVATYTDETITIKDFSDLYDRANFFQRPRREYRLGGIRKFLVDIAMNELIELELESAGIENEPQVARMLTRKQEQLMVDRLYQDLIDKQVKVKPHEMQAYYKDNQALFHREEERRFSVIMTGDRETAERARKQLLDGANFNRVAGRLSIKELVDASGLDDRLVRKGQVPEIDEYGFSLAKVGDISEPFATEEGWAVIKLTEKLPDRIQSFVEAQHDIRHRLKRVKSDEKLDELLAKWRQEFPIEVYENNLKKARLDPRPSRTI